LPVGAEVFRVTLNNGQIFETDYQPQEASWDASMVLLLDDVGNWVGVSKADVQQVATVSETGAYGIMISKNTFELGVSANDAEAEEAALLAANGGQPGQGGKPSALEATQLQLAQVELQQKQSDKNYGVKQFVEPGQTQGIPSRFVSQSPPNRPNTGFNNVPQSQSVPSNQ